MGLSEQQFSVSELEIGMFVSRLDRPWSETDFLLEGVMVHSHKDIEHLARFCKTVTVDIKRSDAAVIARKKIKAVAKPKAVQEVSRASSPLYIDPQTWKSRHCIEHYQVSTTFERELKQVTPLVTLMEHHINQLYSKVTNHRSFQVEPLVECTTDLIESVIRNPDALFWTTRILENRRPVFMHILHLATWACIVGRQLGLNRFTMVHLTMASMMTGVGKSLLSEKTLNEHNVYQHSANYREHLQETLYNLEQTHFSCKDIITTIKHYCERHDGSGYPYKKSGEDIPFLARVVGLIDTFEYLVHPFNNSALSPANAVSRLNKMKGTYFDPYLVETFVQAIGIYPTGSVVEVSNGTIGMVVTNNYEHRIQGSIIPLIKPNGSHYSQFRVRDLNLSSGNDDNSILIKRGLPIHALPQKLVVAAHQQLFEPRRQKGFFAKLLNS